MTDDLVQRLRRTYRKEYAPTGSICGDISNRLRPFPILATEVLFNPDGREAADRIEAQAAEIERLQVEAKAQFDRGYYEGCANPIVRHDALRAHLISALDTLKDAEVCDDNCGPCNEARAALEQSK